MLLISDRYEQNARFEWKKQSRETSGSHVETEGAEVVWLSLMMKVWGMNCAKLSD